MKYISLSPGNDLSIFIKFLSFFCSRYPLLCTFHLDFKSDFEKPDQPSYSSEVESFSFINEFGENIFCSLQIKNLKQDNITNDVSELVTLKIFIKQNEKQIANFGEVDDINCILSSYGDRTNHLYKITFYSTSCENKSQDFTLLACKIENLYCNIRRCSLSTDFRNVFVTFSVNQNLSHYLTSRQVLPLEKFATNGVYSDLTISVGEDKFEVHKIIVCSRSTVLERMINSDMMEKRNNEIKFPDTEPLVMKELLKYLYTNTCNIKKYPQELIKVAHFLDIKDLVTECEIHLIQNITYENIVDLMILADNDQHDLINLKMSVENFIRSNENRLISDPKFIQYLSNSLDDANIVRTLSLIRTHDLVNLKSKVMEYISENNERLLKSDDYKGFLKEEPELALEIMQHMSTYINTLKSQQTAKPPAKKIKIEDNND